MWSQGSLSMVRLVLSVIGSRLGSLDNSLTSPSLRTAVMLLFRWSLGSILALFCECCPLSALLDMTSSASGTDPSARQVLTLYLLQSSRQRFSSSLTTLFHISAYALTQRTTVQFASALSLSDDLLSLAGSSVATE